MQKPRALLFFVAGLVWLAVPMFVVAQGIVPCDGLGCDLCSVGQLMKNIINFLIATSLFVAVVMFAIAGYIYVTSSGSETKVTQAHKLFKDVLIGFLVAISAWLVVQTFISVVFDGKVFIGGNWNQLECSKEERPMNASISQLVSKIIPSVGQPPPSSSSPQFTAPTYDTSGNPTCPSGYVFTSPSFMCVPAQTTGTATLTTSQLAAKVKATEAYAAELYQICTAQGLSDCDLARAVMAIESTGQAGVVSSAGCVGLMQVCPATARTLDPSLAGLTNAQIIQKLTDPTYNMTLGVQYLAQMDQQFDGANLIASYNGGAGANKASVDCPGETYWSCSLNEGYAETRNYVPNVTAAKSLI